MGGAGARHSCVHSSVWPSTLPYVEMLLYFCAVRRLDHLLRNVPPEKAHGSKERGVLISIPPSEPSDYLLGGPLGGARWRSWAHLGALCGPFWDGSIQFLLGKPDYLLAFGPSRHRAWVAGQRPLECSLGSRGRPLGGLLEAVLKPLGGSLGASCGPLGGLWGPLGGLL